MAQDIKWDLSTIFNGYDDPEIEGIIKSAEAKASTLVKQYRGKINSEMTPENILELLTSTEELYLNLMRIFAFSSLSVSSNQTNKEALRLLSRTQNLLTRLRKETSFIDIKLGQLLVENSSKYLESPVLASYKHYLEKTARRSPYKLSEVEEQIVVEKDQYGMSSWSELQGRWVGTRTFDIIIDGKVETIPFGKYRGYIVHPDQVVRKEVITKVMGGIWKGWRTLCLVFTVNMR